MENNNKAKFKLGKVVMTPGAIEALGNSNQIPDSFLRRHQSGDWGEIGDEDSALNDESIAHEGNLNECNSHLHISVTTGFRGTGSG